MTAGRLASAAPLRLTRPTAPPRRRVDHGRRRRDRARHRGERRLGFGWIRPADMISLAASSGVIGNSMMSLVGTKK